MEFKFKVGDEIRILDGSKIEGYAGCWTGQMSELIGKTYKIRKSFIYARGNKPAYAIKDEHDHYWTIDERGALKVEDELPIVITSSITKSGRHKIVAYQDKIEGIAICHPEDKFDYDFGVTLALGRLLQAKKKAKRLEELKKKNAATSAEYTTTAYIYW